MKRIILAALLLCLALPVFAQTADVPALSFKRASLAAGVDYAMWSNPQQVPATAFKKEWEASLFAAYVLTPRFTLTGSGAYLLDSRLIRWRVGVRTVLWKGRDE